MIAGGLISLRTRISVWAIFPRYDWLKCIGGTMYDFTIGMVIIAIAMAEKFWVCN